MATAIPKNRVLLSTKRIADVTGGVVVKMHGPVGDAVGITSDSREVDLNFFASNN